MYVLQCVCGYGLAFPICPHQSIPCAASDVACSKRVTLKVGSQEEGTMEKVVFSKDMMDTPMASKFKRYRHIGTMAVLPDIWLKGSVASQLASEMCYFFFTISIFFTISPSVQ